ncbi:DUF3413 domain-containing protein [Shewanella dokdonensis]|uniref:DUF3413 domain-containing protein n=1 Tax=Shewanella dokdonensis TaxID=712036 RepID=UPI00200C8879|nr:DUF3413 domain-containing protein [Shewanella dokdonensis]MCL1076005.1 DUF3413 domain-containing protein [Shewanella dokdonensis]
MVEQIKQRGRDRVSRLINWGHWFAFFNGILAMLIGIRYLQSPGLPDSLIGWGYLTVSTIGHFSFLSFIVYLVLLFPITLLLPYSRILRGYAAVIACIGLCTLLYDTVVYQDYGMHLTPFAFDLAWADLNGLLQGPSFIIMPVAILVIELIAANWLWKRIEHIQRRNWGNKLVIFIGICFVSSHLVHIWADAADVTEITRFDDTYPISYPATAKTFMENHGIDGSNNPDIKVERSLKYPLAPLQCHADVHPNILLVAVDSFRADLVDEQTMPFLSHYSQQNQLFTHHLSGGNQYSSGMFSLLYGLQGSYMDAVDLNYTSPLLTQTLKMQGYRLALFTTDDGVNEAKPKAIFKDFTPILAAEQGGNALSDIASIDAFQQWRHQQTTPWFALLNLKSPEDYDTPVGFLGTQTVKPSTPLKPAEKVLFNQYRQSLNFIDQQLQRLLEVLPSDTIVLVTGVSGKLFTSNADEAHRNVSPSNVQVPLVIHWPGSVSGKVNYRTSHYGVVPTLMTQVLGCTNPASDYSAGRHLMQPDDQTWLYIGDNRVFAIYQQNEITVIDRHGKYRIYDEDYAHRLHKKMSVPEMIEVMREGRRLYGH